MNPEQTVTAALRLAADVEPDPRGFEAIVTGIARRRRRGRLLLPATAAAVVLALVAGIAALDRVREPATYEPARVPGDLYLEDGSVWPWQSKAAAEAWRRNPSSAPYLADPERAAREFVRRHLDRPDGAVVPLRRSRDSATYFVRPWPAGHGVEVTVACEPGTGGPWVVQAVSPDANNGVPADWRRTRDRRITSPTRIQVLPIPPLTYRVTVMELEGTEYAVLGEATTSEQPPSGVLEVAVAFAEPRGGFGVIAVYATTPEGTLARAHFLPVSLRDPWPAAPRSRPPQLPRPPALGVMDGVAMVTAGPYWSRHRLDTRR